MIQIRGLEFSYQQNTKVILNLPEWTVQAGEKIFVQGLSGSGKTTLLDILAGISVPQKGEVRIKGQELTKMSSLERDHFRRDHVSVIFQTLNLIPYLSMDENLEILKQFNPELKLENKEEYLSRFGLLEFRNKPAGQLSQGQQQRIALIRALLKKPDLLLADEPTSSLDYSNRDEFMKVLVELCAKHGTTLVFVSHDPTLSSYFDRTLKL